jgi:hypothetical protein
MSLQAEVEFLATRSERPVYYASSAGRNAAHEIDQAMSIVAVEVEDARQRTDNDAQDEFGLHPSGFSLHKLPTQMQDFLDQSEIDSIYAVEIESFLRAVTGCYRVQLFDYTVRASDAELRALKQVREPASLVHNDYTPNSGFVCLQESMGDEAAELAQGRFQIINVWRPLVDPVEDFPLALCDTRSLTTADLVDTERRAPNHTGEIQLALHTDEQRWFYFPEMCSDEVLLFKTFDSIDGGVNPCSIHSAIRLPDAPADAKPRESVEARALVFYR